VLALPLRRRSRLTSASAWRKRHGKKPCVRAARPMHLLVPSPRLLLLPVAPLLAGTLRKHDCRSGWRAGGSRTPLHCQATLVRVVYIVEGRGLTSYAYSSG